MSKIVCLMGKSCSGKDTIYKHLRDDSELALKILVPYTTRPIRSNETDGVEYHFVDEEGYQMLKSAGDILEERAYDTACGLWRYFTVLSEEEKSVPVNYLYIATLEAYDSLKEKLGEEYILPVYIEADDGERLERALKRERKQIEPKYSEMCRRFLADTEDFSEENLAASGITTRFTNSGELEDCLSSVKDYIVQSL